MGRLWRISGESLGNVWGRRDLWSYVGEYLGAYLGAYLGGVPWGYTLGAYPKSRP